MNIISSSGTFDDGSNIPLLSFYLGPTKLNIALSKPHVCLALIQTNIREVPKVQVAEVQSSFALNYGAMASSDTGFVLTTNELKTALESMEGIGVEVLLYECDDPTISCSWEVTFASYLGMSSCH